MGYYGNEIEIVKGDTSTIQITLKDSAGDAIDITGYTIWLTVKPVANNSDTVPIPTIQKKVTTFTDPTGGIHLFTLSNSDTNITSGNYIYDIQIKDTESTITTPIIGDFVVKSEVTVSA